MTSSCSSLMILRSSSKQKMSEFSVETSLKSSRTWRAASLYRLVEFLINMWHSWISIDLYLHYDSLCLINQLKNIGIKYYTRLIMKNFIYKSSNMESIQICSSILTKFGILSCLLPYYGWYVHWKFLMMHASKRSRKTWESYTKEFQYISDQMKPLKVVKQNDGLSYFNESTFSAILESKWYCSYPLNFRLSRHDSYSWFLELLSDLFDPNDFK